MRVPFFIHIFCSLFLTACQSQPATAVQGDKPKPSEVSLSADTSKSVIVDSVSSPLILASITSQGQTGFKSIVAHSLKARLIPSNGRRRELGISKIDGIVGVTHFLLDHDLTTGYVHSYTQNFYRKLSPDDFVMKFDRVKPGSDEGFISYVRKGQLQSTDTLGRNVAFFRQWKLSDIDYREEKGVVEIFLMPSTFSEGCVSPQIKRGLINPAGPQIPIWTEYDRTGYLPLGMFSKLDRHNGGTVVIIWEDKGSGKVLFQDVHGSLSEIMGTAIAISKAYNTDPSIAISDAGPMAVKFLSDKQNQLDCRQIPLARMDYAGAGFGYTPQTIYIVSDPKTGARSYLMK